MTEVAIAADWRVYPPASWTDSGTIWSTSWQLFKKWWSLAILGLLVAVFALGLVRLTQVSGMSMMSTLSSGQFISTEAASFWLLPPRRGDIVVLELHPNDWIYTKTAGSRFVKRIVGLPGETIEVSKGKVLINGEGLDEDYLGSDPPETIKPVVVPDGSYYVMGDNRGGSEDSRTNGPLPRDRIVGRVWVELWPLGLPKLPNYSAGTRP